MASVRYMQRGKKKLWAYNIRDQHGVSLAYKSGFSTKKQATIEAEKLLSKLRTGSVLNSSMTLVELYEQWLNLKIYPSKKSETTKRKYKSRVDTIRKLFGDRKVSEIKPSDYQKIMNEYGKEVSRNYLGRLNSGIRLSLQMAIADKLLVEDFTTYVELYSNKEGQNVEDKYLHSEEDYVKILNYLRENFDYRKIIIPYILFVLFKTGMRYGELIALTWSDVNLEEGLIFTHRRFNTSIYKFVPPKNKTSVRYIPISEETIEVLKSLKKIQEVFNRELDLENSRDLVFYHYGYRNYVPNIGTVNKALHVLLTKLNISPMISTKGVRHTYGSYLWHKGIDLGVIAKILGHKDISMLVKVYGHTLEERIIEEFKQIRSIS